MPRIEPGPLSEKIECYLGYAPPPPHLLLHALDVKSDINDDDSGQHEADDVGDVGASRLQALPNPDGDVHAAASHRHLRRRLLRCQRL